MKNNILYLLTLLSLILISGCQKLNEAFKDQQSNAAPISTLENNLKPKVDIVFSVGTGNLIEKPYKEFLRVFPNFASEILNKWDANILVTGGFKDKALSQPKEILSNSLDMDFVKFADAIKPLSTFNGFPGAGALESQSEEHIFSGIQSLILDDNMNFFRSDSILVFIPMSLSEDTDAVTVATNSKSINSDYLLKTKNALAFNKGSSDLVYYFPIVPTTNQRCFDVIGIQNVGYVEFAKLLKSKTFDICSSSIEQSLKNIEDETVARVNEFVFDSIILPNDFDKKTQKVYKDGVEILESKENGYEYIGKVNGAYRVNYPVKAFRGTGFQLKLNGTAKYTLKNIVQVK